MRPRAKDDGDTQSKQRVEQPELASCPRWRPMHPKALYILLGQLNNSHPSLHLTREGVAADRLKADFTIDFRPLKVPPMAISCHADHNS